MHADARGDRTQSAGEVLGAGPLVRVLAQAALDDGPQGVGDGRRAARLGAQVLVQHFERGPAAERRTPGDQLVHQNARPVDVDGGRLRTPLRGLGRDIRGRADELVCPGQPRGVREPGDAEVRQHRVHLAAVLHEQDVRGLEVPVDDAVGMAGGERVGDLGGQEGGGDGAERPVLAEIAVQVGTVDQVHDEREQITFDDEIPYAHDVRVGQPEQHGALPQEPHHDVGVAGELFLEDLDRHGLAGLALDGRLGACRLPLASAPDGACGAASQRLLKEVLAPYRPHVMRSLLLAGRLLIPTHCSAGIHSTGLSSSCAAPRIPCAP